MSTDQQRARRPRGRGLRSSWRGLVFVVSLAGALWAMAAPAPAEVTFTAGPEVAVGAYPTSVAVGDFNGDAKPDLAVANSVSNTVSVRLGNGTGGFTTAPNVGVGSHPTSVAVGDFNGDAKPDLAVTNNGTNTVSVRLGNGTGGFTAAPDAVVRAFPTSVAVGDFNGDGRPDLAVTNSTSNNLSVRLGDGTGGFTNAPNVGVGSKPISVAVGDFNGDGKPDLAVANEDSNTVSVRLGDGAGGFTTAPDVGVGLIPYSVVVGDLNGDGTADLAVPNFGSNTVSVRLGDGAGGFTAAPDAVVGASPSSGAVGDFNSDGMADLAVANDRSNTVSVRLGDGAGGFTTAPDVGVGGSPNSVAVGDFNGDGMADLAVANLNSNTVSIRLGNDPPTISNILNGTIDEDTSTPAVPFIVGDAETAPGSLTLTASSSNTALVPVANIGFGGSGANRTVTLTPAANQSGTTTVRITVSDGTTTAFDDFDLTVRPVNDAPSFTAGANPTVDEDAGAQSVAGWVAEVSAGEAGQTVSYSVTANSNPGLFSAGPAISPAGTLTYTPAPNANGTATITAVARDSGGTANGGVDTSAPRSFTITVRPLNDAPTISDIANRTVNEDISTGAVPFTVGDVETPAGSLTLTRTSSNTALVPVASIGFGGSGAARSVTVIPAPNQSGTATVTVTVTDANGASDSDTFVLTVLSVNDAPTISDIANRTVNEDISTGAVPFTVGDVETPAGSLTLTRTSSNTALVPVASIGFGGSGAARSVTVIPAPNQSGTATVTVTVTDANGASDSDTFVLTVLSVNDAPTISDIANRTVNEDISTGAVPFTVGDVETPAGSLTLTRTSSNTALVPVASIGFGGSGAARSVTVIPAPNQSGTATVTVTVTDANGASDSDTFVLTVLSVNDAPTISDIANRTVNEDISTGAVPFTVGDVETPAGSLTLTRTSSNTALVPVASIGFGGSGAARSVTVIPAPNQSGTATVTVTVTDANGASDSDTFVLTVLSVNDAPTISDIANRTVNEDISTGAVPFTVGDVETPAGSLTLTKASSNTALVPVASIGFGGSGAARSVTVIPAPNQSGTATVTVTVTDANGASDSDTFVLTVLSLNDAPTISDIANRTVNEDNSTGAVPFTVGDVETPAGSLTLTKASSNTALVPVASIGFGGSGAARSVTVIPAPNQSGTATVTVTVTDANGASDSDTFVLTVLTLNDAPTISNIISQTFSEDTSTGAIGFTVGDVETAPGSLTLTGTSSNTALVPVANIDFGGSGAARTVTVTPAANLAGSTTIRITVSDGVASAFDEFVLGFPAVNDVPTISNIVSQTFSEDTSTGAIGFTVGDVETAPGSLTLTGTSSNTALVPVANIVFGGSGAARTVTVTPAANLAGSTTIRITVSDGVASAFDEFVLGFPAVNDVPTISNIVSQTFSEDTSTGAIGFTVGDVETAPGSLTLTGTSSNTALVPVANIVFGGSGAARTVTVTPAANLAGSTTIRITVSDGVASAFDEFVLGFPAVNDVPTISNIVSQTFSEDTSTGAIGFTVGDVETAPGSLTLTGTSSNTALVPVANIVFGGSGAARTVTVTPAANLAGSTTIRITVSDGVASAFDEFVLGFPAVNDVPTISNIVSQTFSEDTSTGAIGFTVGDVETAPGSLTLTGTSSNTALVPVANIDFGGSGAARTVTVTPAANLAGSTTIRITVSDGVASAFDEFVLGFPAVNDVPTISNIVSQTFSEDTSTGAIGFTVGDVETAPGSLTLTGTSSNTALVPVANIDFGGSGAARTVTVTPAANLAGSTTIRITVSDGVASAFDEFVLGFPAVNDVPTFAPGPNPTVDEDAGAQSAANWVAAVDTVEAGQSVSYIVTANSNPGMFSAGPAISPAGTLTYTPAANASGVATITAVARDGGGTANGGADTSAPQSFTITVRAVNDPPTISDIGDRSTPAGTSTEAIAFTVGDTETAAGDLTLSATSSNTALVPVAGVVFAGSGADRTVTVTPAAGQSGTATIGVAVSDGTASATDSFVLTVTAVNNPPTISDIGDRSTPEDTPTGAIAFTVGDAETAAGSLTLSATSSNTALVPVANIVVEGSGATRTVTVTPAPNQSGSTTVRITVSDGTATAFDEFVLTVTPANDAPTISDITDQAFVEDTSTGALPFTVGDLETAAGSLTLTRTSSNTTLVPVANVALEGSGATRTVLVTPAANQSGSATIRVTVSDGTLSAFDEFVVTVNAVNDLPTISTIVDRAINEDASTGAIAFTVGDAETPAGSLTLTPTSSDTVLVPVANIVVEGSGADRTVTVTPAANQSGSATIRLTVSDGVASAFEEFVLNVAPVTDGPTISDIADRAIDEDTATGAIAFTVGDAETPVESLTLSATSSDTALVPVANIVLGGSGADRTVSVTPAANQHGSAAIRITASDGAATGFDEFVLTVNPVNDAPSFTKGPDQSVVQDQGAQTVTGWAGDLSTGDAGQALSFVVTTDNDALFSAPPAVSPTGTLTYASAAGASGTATVTVVAHDDGGTAAGGVDSSAPQAFTITVVADTAAPVCSITRRDVDGEGRKFVEVSAQDAASGITRIDVTTAVNIITPVTTSPSPWLEGTTDPVVITAYKDNQAAPSQVAFVITDRAGNQGSCT